jgi:hypothetical protein
MHWFPRFSILKTRKHDVRFAVSFFLLAGLIPSPALAQAKVRVDSPSLKKANRESKPTEASSDHFYVQASAGGPSAESMLKLCESLRNELQQTWGGKEPPQSWQPKCQVVVHATRAEYLKIVGPGGSQTTGSSLIEVESGKVTSRRIDLLLEPQGIVSALPHELTHVILADRFNGRQPPRWLDEGIAMLADTREKQLLHERDCRDAIASNQAIPLGELLRLSEFTSAAQVPAFYGQSLSLVHMLATKDKPEKLIDFALDAIDQGYDQALQNHYGIEGANKLERQWRRHAASNSPSLQQLVKVSHQP